MSTNSQEIEKKYLLSGPLAPEHLGQGVSIVQAYLPAEACELRLRQKGERFLMTAKSKGGLVRQEWETEIPQWVYASLKPGAQGVVEKVRFHVPWQGYDLEIDEYGGHLRGLWTLECELESVEAAAGFAPPQWAGVLRDVTEDVRFKNRNLASYTGSIGALKEMA
jgi:CYTH domain-containing protein